MCEDCLICKNLSNTYLELLSFLDCGEPEAELVREEVARAASSVTLDEGRGTEVFQTGAGRAKNY
jgi:hypothetical protein